MDNIPVIRWSVVMERTDIGGFVSYHDYAMLYERIESMREDMQGRICIGKESSDEIDTLHARVAELERRAVHAEMGLAIDAVSGYFSRMRGPIGHLVRNALLGSEDFVRGEAYELDDCEIAVPLYAGSAPVPAAQDFSLMQGGYCCECGHELCDTCAPLHPIMPWPAAQAESKVADDVRLGNRLYVWDYENPEDGSWDNIEEYLHDTTPGVGDVVRLNLAMPLQDVEVEMLEVGRSGEPIRWQVRDVKTGAMLAAKAKGGGKENLTTAGQEAVLVEIFHGTRDALNKLSVFPSKDKP